MSKVTILSKPNRIVIASKGVQGPPGPEGPPSTVPGPQGPRGARVRAGSGPPDSLPSDIPGDIYIDNVTGDIYENT